VGVGAEWGSAPRKESFGGVTPEFFFENVLSESCLLEFWCH